MSNPFIEPGPFMNELQRRRRERFKVGVYAVLGISLLFLSGMLIQGCKQQQGPETAAPNPATEPAPAPPAFVASAPSAEPQPPTNGAESPFPTDSPAGAPAVAASAPSASPPPAPAVSGKRAERPATHRAPSAKKVYIVKRGDTLTRIASLHHTSVKALKAANGLKSDRILAGSKLRIPQPRTVAVSSTAAAQS